MEYEVVLWKMNKERWWTFIPLLLTDFTLFLYQFFSVNELAILRIGCIFQFFLSLSLFAHFLVVWYSEPEKLMN